MSLNHLILNHLILNHHQHCILITNQKLSFTVLDKDLCTMFGSRKPRFPGFHGSASVTSIVFHGQDCGNKVGCFDLVVFGFSYSLYFTSYPIFALAYLVLRSLIILYVILIGRNLRKPLSTLCSELFCVCCRRYFVTRNLVIMESIIMVALSVYRDHMTYGMTFQGAKATQMQTCA